MSNSVIKPKQRIVRTVSNLFYRNGINTVGVNTISEQANVSKRTLYKHFPTKEILTVAYLNEQTQNWFGAYIPNSILEPKERITYIFTELRIQSQRVSFHGCPFMNASVELRSGPEALKQTARTGKTNLYDFFAFEATRLSYDSPSKIAEQLVILFDGTNAWIIMHGSFPETVFASLETILA